MAEVTFIPITRASLRCDDADVKPCFVAMLPEGYGYSSMSVDHERQPLFFISLLPMFPILRILS